MKRIVLCVLSCFFVMVLFGQCVAGADTSPEATIRKWQDRTEKIRRQLENGSWAAAEKASEELAGEMAHGVLIAIPMMATQPTLLVVDDDLAMREMLVSLFGDHGYAVAEASSGNDALDQARETDFDAILSDIKMPGKSGIELAP